MEAYPVVSAAASQEEEKHSLSNREQVATFRAGERDRDNSMAQFKSEAGEKKQLTQN